MHVVLKDGTGVVAGCHWHERRCRGVAHHRRAISMLVGVCSPRTLGNRTRSAMHGNVAGGLPTLGMFDYGRRIVCHQIVFALRAVRGAGACHVLCQHENVLHQCRVSHGCRREPGRVQRVRTVHGNAVADRGRHCATSTSTATTIASTTAATSTSTNTGATNAAGIGTHRAAVPRVLQVQLPRPLDVVDENRVFALRPVCAVGQVSFVVRSHRPEIRAVPGVFPGT